MTCRTLRLGLLATAALCFGARVPSFAQETVNVSTPNFVTFTVADISQSSPAGPSVVTISYSDAALGPGMRLKVSVMADAASFSAPGGVSVPVSKVSWTTGGASGGSGYSGTLSSSTFTEVFCSEPDPLSGNVDLTFQLDPVAAGLLAGDHVATLRWKFESVF